MRYKVILAPGGAAGAGGGAAAASGAARRVALAKAARGERPAWLTAGPPRTLQLHDEDDGAWTDVQEAQHAAATRALFELRVNMLLPAGDEDEGGGAGGGGARGGGGGGGGGGGKGNASSAAATAGTTTSATPEEEAARRDAAAADLALEVVAPYAALVARWASREATTRDEGEARLAEEGRAAFLRGLLGSSIKKGTVAASAPDAAASTPKPCPAAPPPPPAAQQQPPKPEPKKEDDDEEEVLGNWDDDGDDNESSAEEWELAAERGDFDAPEVAAGGGRKEDEEEEDDDDNGVRRRPALVAAAATTTTPTDAQDQHQPQPLSQAALESAARQAHHDALVSARLRDAQDAFWRSDEGRQWAARRAALPIAQVRERVLAALRDPTEDDDDDRANVNNPTTASPPNPRPSTPILALSSDVCVVGGETGSGKTTQVPQYLLEDAIARGRGSRARVIVTQPRRIAAVSVAERVSQERGELRGPGGSGSLVGYHVRLDAAATRETRLLFCTTGVLLRRMASDRSLEGVSHVVVDEVHERTLQGDFLMALLRRLVAERRAARRSAALRAAGTGRAARLPPPLKVVLMSATLDAELYADYFGDLDNNTGFVEAGGGLAAVAAGLAVPRSSLPSLFGGGALSPQSAQQQQHQQQPPPRPPNTPVPVIACGGRTFPVEVRYLEDVYGETGYRLAPESRAAVRGNARRAAAASNAAAMAQRAGAGASSKTAALMSRGMGDDEAVLEAATGGAAPNTHYDPGRYAPYPPHVRASLARLEEGPAAVVDLDLVEELVHHIDATRPPGGAILVFLPGMAEIGQLLDRLRGSRRFGGRAGEGGRWVLPLHSSVSPQQQRQAFCSPPRNGPRKVVLATNIAETSVTIEDVVYVVDTGRHKERRHDPKRHVSLLVEDWISAAAAKQRRGRAGRVQPGECFCTYTSLRAERLKKYGAPEISRVPLEELALQIHLLGLEPAAAFLREVIEPPPGRAVEAALGALVEVGAMELGGAWEVEEKRRGEGSGSSTVAAEQEARARARARAAGVAAERLTPLGRHLAALPMEPRLGKLLVLAAALGCLSPALTIAAGMSYRSPFAAAFEEQQELEAARRALAAAPAGVGVGVGGPGVGASSSAAAMAAAAAPASSKASSSDWPASHPPGFRNLAAGQQSDHLVLVAAFDVWRCALRAGGQQGAAKVARHYRLSPQALEAIAELREQFAAMLADVNLLQPPPGAQGERGGWGGGRGGGRGGRGRGRGRGGGRGDNDANSDANSDTAEDDDNSSPHHLSHLQAAVSWADDPSAPHNRLASAPEMVKAVLAAALAPRVAVFAEAAGFGGGGGGSGSNDRPSWRAGAAREAVAVHPGSVNHPLLRHQWRHPQLVYLEKAGSGPAAGAGGGASASGGGPPQRVYLRDTTAVSAAALLLFAGGAPLVLHDEAAVVVGGWLRLRVAPAAAVLVRQLRAALDALLAAAVGGGRGGGSASSASGSSSSSAAVASNDGALAVRVVDAIRLLLAEAEDGGR
jgi:ATP-dependent RNA helicase DHX29